jgi:SOCE-associated regulatory factor of calcium homoeostasis
MASCTAFRAVLLLLLSLGLTCISAVSISETGAAAPETAVARAVASAGTRKDGEDSSADSGSADRVYLRSVSALTFSVNGRTRGRRRYSRTQLECVGGSAAGYFWSGADRYPRIVNCENRGWDGASVQWRCRAELKDGLEFGDTSVTCEGYDGPADDYIVRGSCRLEYTLNYSSAYEISFAHVVYASILSLGLLWFYYNIRFYLHSRMEKLTAAVDARISSSRSSSPIASPAGYYPLPTSASPTAPPAGYPVTGQPLQ